MSITARSYFQQLLEGLKNNDSTAVEAGRAKSYDEELLENIILRATFPNIGDTYGGGVVFYILKPGDIGYVAGVKTGLVAAEEDLCFEYLTPNLIFPYGTGNPQNRQYMPSGFTTGTFIPGTQTAIGTGKANTDVMFAALGVGVNAVSYLKNLTHNGYSDWYLHSLEELKLIYPKRNLLGGYFAPSYYLTSSDLNTTLSWGFAWGNGVPFELPKPWAGMVRPIRTFTIKDVADLQGSNTGDETPATIKAKLGAATAAADGYLRKEDFVIFNSKLDPIAGKGLSTNDYTTTEKDKLAGINNHYRGTYTSEDALNAAVAVGNAGDEAAIDFGVGYDPVRYVWDISDNVWKKGQGTSVTVDNAINSGSVNAVSGGAVYSGLGNKVDKVTGKGLSTNDYTTAEQTKVSNTSGTNTGDNSANSLYSGLDAAKRDKLTTFNNQTGTSYTLVLTDNGKHITFANSGNIDVIIPLNSSVAFPIGTQIDCSQILAGKVSFSPQGGVTLNSKGGLRAIGGQWVGVTLLKTATDVWSLFGDLIA